MTLRQVNAELDRLHWLIVSLSAAYLRLLRELGPRARCELWGWR